MLDTLVSQFLRHFLLEHWQYCEQFGASLDPSCSLYSLQPFLHTFIFSSYLQSLSAPLMYHPFLSAYREDVQYCTLLQYNWLMDNIFQIKGGRNALSEFCTITFGIIYFVRLLNWTALNLRLSGCHILYYVTVKTISFLYFVLYHTLPVRKTNTAY